MPDRSAILVYSGGAIWRYGADLRREKRLLSPTDRSAVERVQLSPDGTWVAAAVRGTRVVIVSVSDGRVLHSIDGDDLAQALGAVSPTQLFFQRGCQLFLVDVQGTAGARPMGPPMCDPIVNLGHRNGAVWLAVGMPFTGYQVPVAVDLETGEATRVMSRPEGTRLEGITMAPAGSRFCWIERGEQGRDLFCNDRLGAEPRRVAADVDRLSAVADSGDRLLYLTEGEGGRDVWLVDFASDSVRRVATGRPYEWWDFLPGDTRIVGHGAQNGAEIIDLTEGWSVRIGRPREELEDVDLFPGDADHFLIRRDSSPPALVHVDLAPVDSSARGRPPTP